MDLIKEDERFMGEALKEALKANEKDEVPVGAVIVCNGIIIARSYNYTEHLNDSTAHAEMQAITSASNHIGAKYLTDCTIYVTLEPCVMCAGALFWSQMGRLVYGASDPKRGYSMVGNKLLHPKTVITNGIKASECSQLIQDFFKRKREF